MLNLEALDALGLGEDAPAVSADATVLFATPQHGTEGTFGGMEVVVFFEVLPPLNREWWASLF